MVCQTLIIEDEPGVARVVEACLQRAGHAVRTAGSGEIALRMIAARRPDLVVLDHQLPGISGLDLLVRLKAAMPEIKVVMLTGRANVPMVVEAMSKGAADFLTKPVDFDKLLRVVGELVGATERPAEPADGLGARLLQVLPDGLRRVLAEARDEFGGPSRRTPSPRRADDAR